MIRFLVSITLVMACNISHAQNHILNATIALKSNIQLKGDVFRYDTYPNTVTVKDSIGKSLIYDFKDIDYIRNSNFLLKSIEFENTYLLFETLLIGQNMNLYKINVLETEIFYVQKAGILYLLEGGDKIVKVDSKEQLKGSKQYLKEINTYKGTLIYLMKSDPSLVNEINRIKYTQKDISDLVLAFNQGVVSYIKTNATELINRKPNWLTYVQYSHSYNNSYFTDENTTPNFFGAGVLVYLSESSRHSIKMGMEYGTYSDPNQIYWSDYLNLNINYNYDYYSTRNADFYLSLRLIDFGYVLESNTGDSYIGILPRLSPGLGYQHRIGNKLRLYGEINNILKLLYILNNFSFGISFDI